VVAKYPGIDRKQWRTCKRKHFSLKGVVLFWNC